MKKQYMRLFKHKDDTMPVDSFQVGDVSEGAYCDREDAWVIMDDWQQRNPDGKVDFVWL